MKEQEEGPTKLILDDQHHHVRRQSNPIYPEKKRPKRSVQLDSGKDQTKVKSSGKTRRLGTTSSSMVVCSMELIETIPPALLDNEAVAPLARELKPTLEAWLDLLDIAEDKIEISSQWSLINDWSGKRIYKGLEQSVLDYDINLRFVHTGKRRRDSYPPQELHKVAPKHAVVKALALDKLIDQGGIVHSKYFLIDR